MLTPRACFIISYFTWLATHSFVKIVYSKRCKAVLIRGNNIWHVMAVTVTRVTVRIMWVSTG